MSRLGIFLFEPEINQKYSLMFTKSFPFIKIFGKEILWWSIKNALENNESDFYDIFVYLHKEQQEDIIYMIEKISKSNYSLNNKYNFTIKNLNINIEFVFNKDEFNKIKDAYKYKNLTYPIGKISEKSDLNKMSDLISFFSMINYSAEKYYYVPEHERQRLFNLYK